MNEIKKIISLREFKLRGIRCVSVRQDEDLIGFYVGTDDDWSDGIITKKDLKSLDEIKKDINLNCCE